MTNIPHVPVMAQEVIELLKPSEIDVSIDATFGAGGYSKLMLSNGCKHVIAFDQDNNTEKYFLDLLKEYPDSISFINDNFRNIKDHINKGVDAFVFDIGVSSMQLDQADRGFSFSKDGALDMRMDRSNTLTAAEVVNTYEERRLADIIFQYGGEKKSRQIARYISNQREEKPFASTLELANAITKAVGRYNDEIHPATRTFQALRIEVNKELDALSEGLAAAAEKVEIGGKIIVVTFHSLEDAIVKKYFASICGALPNNNRHMPELLNRVEDPKFAFLTRKALSPSKREIDANPRARSAKLRAVRRIA